MKCRDWKTELYTAIFGFQKAITLGLYIAKQKTGTAEFL